MSNFSLAADEEKFFETEPFLNHFSEIPSGLPVELVLTEHIGNQQGIEPDKPIKILTKISVTSDILLQAKSNFFSAFFKQPSRESSPLQIIVPIVDVSAFYMVVQFLKYQTIDIKDLDMLMHLIHYAQELDIDPLGDFIADNIKNGIDSFLVGASTKRIFDLAEVLRRANSDSQKIKAQDRKGESHWQELILQNFGKYMLYRGHLNDTTSKNLYKEFRRRFEKDKVMGPAIWLPPGIISKCVAAAKIEREAIAQEKAAQKARADAEERALKAEAPKAKAKALEEAQKAKEKAEEEAQKAKEKAEEEVRKDERRAQKIKEKAEEEAIKDKDDKESAEKVAHELLPKIEREYVERSLAGRELTIRIRVKASIAHKIAEALEAQAGDRYQAVIEPDMPSLFGPNPFPAGDYSCGLCCAPNEMSRYWNNCEWCCAAGIISTLIPSCYCFLCCCGKDYNTAWCLFSPIYESLSCLCNCCKGPSRILKIQGKVGQGS